jgi:YD repeat-containing protein
VLLAATMSGTQYAKAETQIYYEPGINPYREQASQDGIESIDPYTGMLKVQHVDLFIPGNGGLDIKVMRTYDSAGVYQLGVGGIGLASMGYGWLFHFGKLTGSYVCQPHYNTTVTRPVFELSDGIQIKFLKAPTGFSHLYTSQEGWIADCANSPDGGGLIVVSPDGLRYEMTVRYSENGINFFQVKKITDRHGNWLSFDYQITGVKPYVTRCVASDGRLVSFTYSPGVTTGNRVYQITANGQTWQYDYTSNGAPLNHGASASSFELAKVTRPDGSSWSYEYPTFPSYYSPFVIVKGYLAKITRPEGGSTTYTYSYVSTEVLGGAWALRVTQKTVRDGVMQDASWAYRYKFWESVGGSRIGLSTTDIADPAGGLTTYRHETPYAATGASAWRIGLLIEKLECSSNGAMLLTCDPATSINREQNEWGSQVISPDVNLSYTAVEPYVDAQTNRPLLTKRTITRDGTSYVTQYQLHDAHGNPARLVESGNGFTRTTDLTYYNDTAKWVVGKPDRETIDGIWVTDRTFDTNGRVTSINKYGVATTFSYHTHGEVASMTDAQGNQTAYSDYFRGVARMENQPGDVTLSRTVNLAGTIATETNGEGHTTRYAYDGLNRLTRVELPTGNATDIEWEPPQWHSPAFTKRVTRGGFEETIIHDGFGRVVESTKLDTATQARVRRIFRYDGLGRKMEEYYPTISATTVLNALPRVEYTYDAKGRLTQIRHADGKTRKLQYLAGDQVRVTDENGRVYTYTYRSFGDPDERQLMNVAAPLAAASMTVTRNALGQITGMTQGGVSRTMQYDSRGYLVKTYHPEIGWVTYGRDAVGNPVSKSVGVAPGVRTVNYLYDNRNRLTASTYQDATTPAVTLSYNRVDDVVGASRGGIARTYAYDANRNLTDEALHVDGRVFGLRYDYDGNDAVSHVTYPDGQVVGFRPDALGRPTEVSPYVVAIGYHPSGQVSSMAYANGVSTTQAFNARLWPQQMSVIAPAGTLLNTAYGYDGLGNVTSMVDGIDASYNRTLSYDAIDRLISATGPWGAGSITYDGRGNLLSQNYGTTYSRTYTYDTSNRLASYTGSSAFTYDAWGNATRSGNALSYHLFDDASNLYCASCDSANPLRFEYDANNYRVKKVRNGIATYSFYAKDGNLMMEYTPSSGDLKQFAYHNKKQIAMRHVIDPAMVLGQASMLDPNRFAASAIPFKTAVIETDVLSGLIPSTPLLSIALLASAD